MSLSSDSLALCRKHTATERAENNGDPLVAKEKAREAAKSSNLTTLTPAIDTSNAGPAPNVSLS